MILKIIILDRKEKREVGGVAGFPITMSSSSTVTTIAIGDKSYVRVYRQEIGSDQ